MKQLLTIVVFIIKIRVPIIIALVGMMIFSAYFTINRLSVDNSLSIWFLEDNPSYNAYIDYQEEFGSDEIFVAMIPVENAIAEVNITTLKQLHNTIDSLWFVKETFSLAKAKYPIYANKTIVYDDLYTNKRSEKGLKNLYAKLPNITQQLVTPNYKNLFFYIQLKPTPLIEKSRAEIAPAIRHSIEKYVGEDYFLTGAPVLNEAYSLGIYKESLVFGILTILVITIMLLFLLPDKRYLLMALFSVAIPITILFGIITSLGFALNMISMLIPTILMVYSVSDVVHIINIYHKEGLTNAHIGKTTLIALTVRKSLTPCFYTTLTTIVGYFALYLSPLPAFKNMGVFTCLGLLLSFLLVYIISIIGFSFLHSKFKSDRPILKIKGFNYHFAIDKMNKFTSINKNSIIIVFTVFLIFGIWSVLHVKLDTNSLDLLAEGKAKQDLRIVESQLNGSSRLQLNITSLEGEEVVTKEVIIALEEFQKKLEKIDLLATPVSIIDIQKFLEQRSPVLFQSNVSAASLQELLKNNTLDSGSFYKLFSDDFKTLGVSVNVKEIKTSELEALLRGISKSFNSSFDNTKYKLTINGFSVVFSEVNDFILETQFKSFFAAFFVAFLALWFFIKSIKTTFLVLVPNILPLAVLAIVMAWLDIPLDVSTAMITPIMLGIAMDDTIHLVYKYKRTKGVKGSAKTRINKAMKYTGSALLSTTIALVAGFLIISSSAIPSVSDFGILCAVTVFVALITDILYLPALLKKFDS